MRSLAIILLCSAALADAPKPHALTPLDLAQLDAALAHIEAIDQEARQKKAPYAAKAQAICERYGFSCADIGSGVMVNPETGAVTDRRPKPEPQKAQLDKPKASPPKPEAPKPKAEPAKK